MSVPDAHTAHLLPTVEADPCTQSLFWSSGCGEAGSAEVRPWCLQPGTGHFSRPLVLEGNNAGLPSTQALLRVYAGSDHKSGP